MKTALVIVAPPASLLSAASDIPAPKDAVVFGEIGLSGEIRGVSQTALRLKEAAKLGFNQAVKPPSAKGERAGNISLTEISHLRELLTLLGWEPGRQNNDQNSEKNRAIPQTEDAYL